MKHSKVSLDSVDVSWKNLYRVGALAAWLALLVFRRNLGAEISLISNVLVPESAHDWFVLLQEHRFVGLVYFNLFDLVNYALVGVLFLALYGALKKTARGWMAIAVGFAFVGIAVNFASNQAFAMLSLSTRYVTATIEAQRALFLAAGEGALAINNPGAQLQGTATYTSLLLVLLAGLIISLVMLRSAVFGGVTAYLGLAANGLALGYFAALIFFPALYVIFPVASAPFRVAWYAFCAIRLWRLAGTAPAVC